MVSLLGSHVQRRVSFEGVSLVNLERLDHANEELEHLSVTDARDKNQRCLLVLVADTVQVYPKIDVVLQVSDALRLQLHKHVRACLLSPLHLRIF